MQARVATGPQFCGLEIVKAIPDRRQRGIQKAGEHRGTRRADPRLLGVSQKEFARRVNLKRLIGSIAAITRGCPVISLSRSRV